MPCHFQGPSCKVTRQAGRKGHHETPIPLPVGPETLSWDLLNPRTSLEDAWLAVKAEVTTPAFQARQGPGIREGRPREGWHRAQPATALAQKLMPPSRRINRSLAISPRLLTSGTLGVLWPSTERAMPRSVVGTTQRPRPYKGANPGRGPWPLLSFLSFFSLPHTYDGTPVRNWG